MWLCLFKKKDENRFMGSGVMVKMGTKELFAYISGNFSGRVIKFGT